MAEQPSLAGGSHHKLNFSPVILLNLIGPPTGPGVSSEKKHNNDSTGRLILLHEWTSLYVIWTL